MPKASLILVGQQLSTQGGVRWWDSSNSNNKALRLGGPLAEVMHNSSGKLIKSPFPMPIAITGNTQSHQLLVLPSAPFLALAALQEAVGLSPGH